MWLTLGRFQAGSVSSKHYWISFHVRSPVEFGIVSRHWMCRSHCSWINTSLTQHRWPQIFVVVFKPRKSSLSNLNLKATPAYNTRESNHMFLSLSLSLFLSCLSWARVVLLLKAKAFRVSRPTNFHVFIIIITIRQRISDKIHEKTMLNDYFVVTEF